LTLFNSRVTEPKFTKFLHNSQVVADEPFKIRMAIFRAGLECQGDEWKWIGRFRPLWL